MSTASVLVQWRLVLVLCHDEVWVVHLRAEQLSTYPLVLHECHARSGSLQRESASTQHCSPVGIRQ